MATATKRKGQGQDKAAAKKKKCECGKARPSFGMPGDAPKDAKWCIVCPGRVEGAVNVKSKKCECGKAPAQLRDARRCAQGREVVQRVPLGVPGDAPTDAKWCIVCPGRVEGAVDVKNTVGRCKACGVRVVWRTTLELLEEDFCKLCYEERYPPPERAPRRGPIKEQAVQVYLARRLPKLGGERLCGWRFNQQVPHSRTCRRKLDAYYLKGACIDAVPGMKGTAINVEVQENQHDSYDSEDEEQRCFDIIEAVEETLGRGYATFLARINPDSYTDSDGVLRESAWSRQCEAVVSHEEWGRRLVVLERCLRSVEKQLGLVELFHDGFNAKDWGEISDEDAIKASKDSGVMEMSEWRRMYH